MTWLPPNGDVDAGHLETLGDMISEAFHQHKEAVYNKKKNDAKKAAKQTSTAAEVSECNTLQHTATHCITSVESPVCAVSISPSSRSNVVVAGIDYLFST